MREGRTHAAAASTLACQPGLAVEIDPDVICRRGVLMPVNAAKLQSLDEEGWIYGYAEVLDPRAAGARRGRMRPRPPASAGRRATDLQPR